MARQKKTLNQNQTDAYTQYQTVMTDAGQTNLSGTTTSEPSITKPTTSTTKPAKPDSTTTTNDNQKNNSGGGKGGGTSAPDPEPVLNQNQLDAYSQFGDAMTEAGQQNLSGTTTKPSQPSSNPVLNANQLAAYTQYQQAMQEAGLANLADSGGGGSMAVKEESTTTPESREPKSEAEPEPEAGPSEAGTEIPTEQDAFAASEGARGVDATKRRRRRAGYAGTILTGPTGVLAESTGRTILG